MNTIFINKIEDFKGVLSDRILNMLNSTDDLELINAEVQAIAMVRDALGEKFNLDAELSATGTSRNATLLRWLVSLSAYFIYGQASGDDTPERIIKNYDDVRAELLKVSQGKMNVSLIRATSDGEKVTRFQYGSETRRSHNPY